MRSMKAPRPLLALVVTLAAIRPGHATPSVAVETHVVLTIDAMTVDGDRSTTAGLSREAELGPSQPATVDFSVPWGPDGARLSVRFEARLTSVSPDGEAVLLCESTVTRAGRTPVRSSREIRLADEGSGLFEIFGDNSRRLLLTLRGEQVARAVVRPPAAVGAPVRFLVAIERVDGERIVPLETNELNTFVGQSVEYSFRQGQDEGLEVVRLVLLPSSISGDIVTIEADLSGALPGSGGTVLVSRRERIVASKGATSRVSATTGTPPAGYRFQVTPDF
jgi:hypothetical protein